MKWLDKASNRRSGLPGRLYPALQNFLPNPNLGMRYHLLISQWSLVCLPPLRR
jgi:hypothetical protein